MQSRLSLGLVNLIAKTFWVTDVHHRGTARGRTNGLRLIGSSMCLHGAHHESTKRRPFSSLVSVAEFWFNSLSSCFSVFAIKIVTLGQLSNHI